MIHAGELDFDDPVVELLNSRQRFRTFARIEKDVLSSALDHHDGNRSATARALGIGRTTLWRKMVAYGLS